MSFEMTSFRLFALLLVGSRLSLCCLAQQPQTTAPSSQSAPAATQTSRKQDEKQIEKKEQSQRMLGVVPMFGVTSRQNAPPLRRSPPGGSFIFSSNRRSIRSSMSPLGCRLESARLPMSSQVTVKELPGMVNAMAPLSPTRSQAVFLVTFSILCC